jgi:hypothetical protein
MTREESSQISVQRRVVGWSWRRRRLRAARAPSRGRTALVSGSCSRSSSGRLLSKVLGLVEQVLAGRQGSHHADRTNTNGLPIGSSTKTAAAPMIGATAVLGCSIPG